MILFFIWCYKIYSIIFTITIIRAYDNAFFLGSFEFQFLGILGRNSWFVFLLLTLLKTIFPPNHGLAEGLHISGEPYFFWKVSPYWNFDMIWYITGKKPNLFHFQTLTWEIRCSSDAIMKQKDLSSVLQKFHIIFRELINHWNSKL